MIFGSTSTSSGDAQRAHRVDFLGDGHGADLRRIRRAGAAGSDDGGDQRREFAQHGEAHEIGDVNIGAIAAQLIGALVRNDDAEQKRQQPDDRQRGYAGALHVVQDRAPADARRMRDAGRQSERAFADEAQERIELLERGADAAADAFEPPALRCGRQRRGWGVFDEVDQAFEFRSPAAQCRRDAFIAQALEQILQHPHTDGVERFDTRAVYRHCLGATGRYLIELAVERADAERGPAPGQLEPIGQRRNGGRRRRQT